MTASTDVELRPPIYYRSLLLCSAEVTQKSVKSQAISSIYHTNLQAKILHTCWGEGKGMRLGDKKNYHSGFPLSYVYRGRT